MSILGFGVGVGSGIPRAVVASPAFPSTGLVAYWGFDDSLTDSVGSKVLTASGGDSYVTGKLGTKALQLTSTNTASIIDATVGGYFTAACSFQIWVKAADHTAGPSLVAGDQFSLIYDGANVYLTYDTGDSGASAVYTTSLADDTWAHFVVTSGGAANALVYMNGSLVATGDTAVALTPANSGVTLAGGTTTTTLDGFAIWNVELTAQQVSNLYNSGAGNSPA